MQFFKFICTQLRSFRKIINSPYYMGFSKTFTRSKYFLLQLNWYYINRRQIKVMMYHDNMIHQANLEKIFVSSLQPNGFFEKLRRPVLKHSLFLPEQLQFCLKNYFNAVCFGFIVFLLLYELGYLHYFFLLATNNNIHINMPSNSSDNLSGAWLHFGMSQIIACIR